MCKLLQKLYKNRKFFKQFKDLQINKINSDKLYGKIDINITVFCTLFNQKWEEKSIMINPVPIQKTLYIFLKEGWRRVFCNIGLIQVGDAYASHKIDRRGQGCGTLLDEDGNGPISIFIASWNRYLQLFDVEFYKNEVLIALLYIIVIP